MMPPRKKVSNRLGIKLPAGCSLNASRIQGVGYSLKRENPGTLNLRDYWKDI